MHCIFCKSPSSSSKSIEHIVPKSLGNEEHVLPPGWVCDACNNYLSRKVEAPFLNSEYGKRARFEMRIPSRRGKIPITTGFHPQSETKLNLAFGNDGMSVFAADGEDETNFINSLKTQTKGSLYIPHSGEPPLDYTTARFVGMIALEVLAYRSLDADDSNRELIEKEELDELRNYVRRGKPGFVWPIHMRRIYEAEHQFTEDDVAHQVLHEWNILHIPSPEEPNSGEYYVVLAILGMEYAINIGGPELEGYMKWLGQNNNRSFLY